MVSRLFHVMNLPDSNCVNKFLDISNREDDDDRNVTRSILEIYGSNSKR